MLERMSQGHKNAIAIFAVNAVVIGVTVATYVINPFNTLRNRDPRVGEIVAFRYPPDPAISYVKRVVATGGTTVEMRKGALYVDGQVVDEPWLPAVPIRTAVYDGMTTSLREEDIHSDLAPRAVPENHFFVLGDNRGNSSDCRVWGFVPRENMIGIVAED